jgi:indole-3-glycerol phosphate synthase
MDRLARIADDRRRRIEELKTRTPGHVLRSHLGVSRPNGRLERALRRPRPADPLRMICEFKRASPSRGMLNEVADPIAMAKLYDKAGAAAMSIVTEPDHFHGDLDWMNQIREVTKLPLLLKDFVLDSWQLLDAAVRGADGVLLIAALLSEVQMQRLIGEAKLLGLDPLVEVHDADELKIALRAGATIVGVNNRNLHTFEVRLETSIELMPLVPPLITAVAESGLSTPEDLMRLRATRCDAVLMGEVFMTSPEPAQTLERLHAAARG